MVATHDNGIESTLSIYQKIFRCIESNKEKMTSKKVFGTLMVRYHIVLTILT